MASGHWNIFEPLHIPHEYHPVAGALLAGTVLTVVGLKVRSDLKNLDKHILPEPKANLVNISSAIIGGWRSLLDGMIGHGSEKFLSIVVTTFLFILTCNLLGVMPGGYSATSNLNTNLAMGAFVFAAYNYFGIKEHGWHYAMQFTGGLPPKGYGRGITIVLSIIAVLMFCIETVGHFVRPVSLSFRLWGNLTADHTLVGVFLNITPYLIPVIFMVFGIFVSFVQAFVFALLSTVYFKLAVSHDH